MQSPVTTVFGSTITSDSVASHVAGRYFEGESAGPVAGADAGRVVGLPRSSKLPDIFSIVA